MEDNINTVCAADVGEVRPAKRKPRLAINSPHLHKLQRRHFFLYDILPLLATVLVFFNLDVVPLSSVDVGIFLFMWAATGIGLTVGYHRLFCHRAFKTTKSIRVLLTIFGCMAGRSSMITWTAQHRRHHQIADHEGDVHSPNLHGTNFFGRLHGWFYSHFSWMIKHDYPNIAHYVPDLLADKDLVKIDKYYQVWIVVGLILPGVIGGLITLTWSGFLSGVIWGGVVRLCLVAQQISFLNSFNHMFGSRPFLMPDNNSRNIAFFGVLSWGEGWHNNHHAFPGTANFGYRWYHMDFGYYVIRALEIMGLARDVKRLSPKMAEAKKSRLAMKKHMNTGFDVGAKAAMGGRGHAQ